MRYPGSKTRYVKQLIQVIQDLRGDRDCYVEPFLGGANSFSAIAPLFRYAGAGDAHEDIARMWRAVSKGWLPPESISEEKYRAMRDADPSALRGFVGSGCSFGGKWFGGYARGGFNGDVPRNHQAESFRAIKTQQPSMLGRKIFHRSYDQWNIKPRMVVYCDPPYQNTLKYHTDFDHDKFWSVMNEWSETGALVLISEQTAPDGWEPVLTFSRLSSTALAHDRKSTVEHVWRMIR